jgi:hypothetical protein
VCGDIVRGRAQRVELIARPALVEQTRQRFGDVHVQPVTGHLRLARAYEPLGRACVQHACLLGGIARQVTGRE